jgi:pilus assembly protein CpaD
MLRLSFLSLMLVSLAACSSFTPREKVARYDPTSGLTLPHPCPDWSQPQTGDFANELHSNFGCAVNTNAAIQLENPEDMRRGKGKATPDTEVTTRVVERYRAGEIPEPLEPVQDGATQ